MEVKLFFLLILTHQSLSTERIAETKKRIISKMMDSEEYNSLQRPFSDGGEHFGLDGETIVETNMFIRSLGPVDIYNMDFEVDITLRQSWRDPRLAYESDRVNFVNIPDEDSVWRPDTFIRNDKESSFSLVPAKAFYIRVYPDGKVLHSVRIKSKLYCPLNLRSYPFDYQTCTIMLASYGHHKSEIAYKWKDTDPINFPSTYHLSEMDLISWQAETNDIMTATGTYSTIQAKIQFKRQSSYVIMTQMIPLIMLGVISCLGFWIKSETGAPSLIINLIMLVFASFKVDNLNDLFPPVGYTKAIDVFSGFTILFIFIAFVISVVFYSVDSQVTYNISSFKKMSAGEKFSKFGLPCLWILFCVIFFGYYSNLWEPTLENSLV